ncbi:hypothetical protein LCGC14_1994420 [marine sediment metagenome]|uniref:Mechanosensitive ion channel MscS domain-containing protein n=1 Tax=marine sediment metagenome TaxID=412755 RepID=A0A0F9FT46_9ZZZZ
MYDFMKTLGQWGTIGIYLVLAVAVGLVVNFVVFFALNRATKRTSNVLDKLFLKHFKGPLRLAILLLCIHVLVSNVQKIDPALPVAAHVIGILLIISIAWMLIRLSSVVYEFLLLKYQVDQRDNLEARKIHTQFRILRNVFIFTVILVSFSAVLMRFEVFQRLGTGILASAGIAGLVIGLAAQRTLSNLLAGIQIALAQPIRIDDVVIVENEWGWIEEISLTYVVVRIWDLRRLILPISYFLEKPFQNWTHKSADILGTIYLYMDYNVPVPEVRNELKSIVEQSPHWDGKVCGLVVTNATDSSIELRALVSAEDSPKAWDLRCEVREKLIEFIRDNYPSSLPISRVRFVPDNADIPPEGNMGAGLEKLSPKSPNETS